MKVIKVGICGGVKDGKYLLEIRYRFKQEDDIILPLGYDEYIYKEKNENN